MGETVNLIKAARSEAFLEAARIYVQLEEFPNRDILIGLLSQGMIMPEKEEKLKIRGGVKPDGIPENDNG